MNGSPNRILIVGINYAPEHAGIAPYTTQAAEYFAAQGDDVVVFTGVPHYPHWSVPEEFRRRLRTDEHRNGIAVRRLRHFVPAEQSAAKRGLYELTFGLHAAVQRLPWRPDVVVAVVPSLFGAAAAATIARRSGARFVLWIQDLMANAARQSGIAGGGRVAAMTGRLERAVLDRAADVIVLNDAFRSHVEKVAPRATTHVLPNWAHVNPPRADRVAVRERLGWRDGETIALHAGNMGLKQGLDLVVEAARRTKHYYNVRFVLMGDGSQRRALEATGAGVPSLDFLPPAAEADFMDVLAAADILLVTEASSVIDMSLPSKLTSYFSAGRPVIAAVNRGGGSAAQVSQSGGGIIVEPAPDPLLNAVVALGASPIKASSIGARGAEFAREKLNGKLVLRRLRSLIVADVVARD